MMMVWPLLDPVLSDGLLSDCGRLAGCGGSVSAGCIPCIGSASLVWLLVPPGWVVGIEISHQDCVLVAGEQIIEGIQIWYMPPCANPQ